MARNTERTTSLFGVECIAREVGLWETPAAWRDRGTWAARPIGCEIISMNDASATPSDADVRRQLERMLRSRVFARRPQSAALLRTFVEESIRNGFAPVDHRVIASRLGRDDGADRSVTADVRANVARLHEAIGRYYAETGRDDLVVFEIVQESCRLDTTSNGTEPHGTAAEAARRLRLTLPLVVIVEPTVSGIRQEPEVFSRDVSLLLISMLVRSSRVTVGGLLVRERIAAAGQSATSMAGRLGYEYAVESEIRIEGRRYDVRMVISGMNPAARVLEATTTVDPWDPDSLADDVAAWMSQRIDAMFAPQD
jgi:hypothetical protein